MIKNFIRFGVLLVTALLFATCAAGAFVDSSMGNITFAFPSGALSRGFGDITYDVAIYYGLDLYETKPTIAGDELSFTDLPTGDVRIIVARGRFDDDGFFYAEEYGQLMTTIVAGKNGPYTLNLLPRDFVWVNSLQGSDVVGLAALEGEDDDSFYAATVDSLIEGSYADGVLSGVTVVPYLPDNVAVSSLSVGKTYIGDVGEGEWIDQVWVNGSWSSADGGGIMPWGESGLDETFSDGFDNPENRKDGNVADLTVLYSGAFEVPDDDLEGVAIMFQRDGGIGGIYLTAQEFSDTEEWPTYERPWIVDEINFNELLSDVVEEGTDFVKGFVVSTESSAAYVITAIATLKVSEEMVAEESAFASADDVLSSDAVAYAPDLGAPFVSVDVGGSGDNEVIYLGSENGLFAGSSSENPAEFFDGTGTLIDGTAGYYIKLVSASPDNGMVAFSARRGDNPELLIIVNTVSDKVVDLRKLQGLPGNELHNLVWLDTETLAVSGDHGLAMIDAAALF
jgi:hypothetical protein